MCSICSCTQSSRKSYGIAEDMQLKVFQINHPVIRHACSGIQFRLRSRVDKERGVSNLNNHYSCCRRGVCVIANRASHNCKVRSRIVMCTYVKTMLIAYVMPTWKSSPKEFVSEVKCRIVRWVGQWHRQYLPIDQHRLHIVERSEEH